MEVERASGAVLDESAALLLSGGQRGALQWCVPAHCTEARKSALVCAGERLELQQWVLLTKDVVAFIRFAAGAAQTPTAGLACELSVNDQAGAAFVVAQLRLPEGKQSSEWTCATLDLSAFAGRTVRGSVTCCASEPRSADKLALADFCIAPADQIPLLLSRTWPGLRAANEMEHFSAVYRHEAYAVRQNALAVNARSRRCKALVQPRKLGMQQLGIKDRVIDVLPEPPPPLPGDSAYSYAGHLLGRCMKESPPQFEARLARRAAAGKVRVLSLCAGAARIEATFAAQAGPNVSWTLLDINDDLLNLAAEQFADDIELDLVNGNANTLLPSGEKWDVIMCVSGLHHIVELESLFAFCHASLSDDGELWLIGENVGRNGNRLWPDARRDATSAFASLPERLRRNRHTGQVDAEIPDRDYSVGCFEGIRSEEIEPLLWRWFHTEHVYRRNCFLWRIVDLAYSDNYDLSSRVDQEYLHEMVRAEYRHYSAGGRGTELFGVYRPRTF